MVVQLMRLIRARKLTPTAAAKRIGIEQPDLSNILGGHYRGYSVERLMRMLTAFDQDVEITVKPHEKAGEGGRISFVPLRAWAGLTFSAESLTSGSLDHRAET